MFFLWISTRNWYKEKKVQEQKLNNGRFYARDVKVVDYSQLSVNGHLELVPAFL